MSSNIRVGVIGAGNISGAHLPVLSALDGIALTCICDIRPERAKAAAEKYGCEYTTDWEALVAREDIDSVHVLTPHYLHARMAIACLEAGKHVLTEKPMASELADARRMIAVSREHPELKLGVIFQNRYNPATVELKKIMYIEGLKDYIKIHIENEPKAILSLISMKAMEEKLPSKHFVRVHRSFIVQKSKIKVIDRGRIVFGKEYIPISDSYKQEIQTYLNSHSV